MKHRLPSEIIPNKYTISIKPDLEKFIFTGEETIAITIKKPTKKITLHAVELEITHVELEGETAKVAYDNKTETATLTFLKQIGVGDKELKLEFKGILNDKMRGFYRSQYDIEGQKMHMATTQFEATDARRAFPCFDEPALKAVFDVTLIIPSDHTAISNTIDKTIKEHGSGFKTITFAPTPKMSTYLLAFIVGKFESIETKTAEGVTVRVFTTPGKKHQAEFALQTAAKVLSFYNEYFAIPYPLPVLDLIAIPDFAAGAMENWGAMTFRETTLLVDPQHSSTANKQWVALVIAHEIAHQWFGDLVTMEWWTHLWLNEGFACFIEYLAVDAIFPQWEIWKQFISTEHNDALRLDGLKNTHPIEVEVKHPSEISEIFDEVSYAKGASIIRMLWLYLGQVDFRDGLRLYLKTHAYGNTRTEDLWEAFKIVSKKPVGKVMKNWTQKGGYPLITVEEKQNSLILSQKRFFISNLSAQATKDTTTWNIPLKLLTNEGEDNYLMDKKKFVIPAFAGISGSSIESRMTRNGMTGWVKVNAGESSFVRVHYPKTVLERLKPAIETGAISEIDKLGIIRDAFVLSEAGFGSTVDALSLGQAYKIDRDYVVWAELSSHIHKIGSLIADNKELSQLYTSFARDMFAEIAKTMGWKKQSEEKHTAPLLRSLALYGYGTYGDRETIQMAQAMFHDFTQSGKVIEPDLRGVVYTLVAENGGEKEWNIFVDLHKKESMHQEKDRIARALTVFKNKELLIKTLEWSLSDNLRAQDSPRILYAVFVNENGRNIAWDFVVSHWEVYKKKYAGGHGFSRVMEAVGVFTTDKMADTVENFFEKNPTPEIDRTIKQIVEKIRANADWLKREERPLEIFLKKC
jgi:puromycin-sensitive aminopeptidase